MCLGIPAKIISIKSKGESYDLRARAEFGHLEKEISLAFLPEAKVGDYVLVHVGVALSVINPEEAQKTLDFFSKAEDE